ncbi:MAG: TRAP transporter large permease subunit [Rubrivivax sp.]|nr:TRAP transporter large permease subunit [Rubrivivax sp.]
MTLVPLLEIVFRPLAGRGVDNAAVLVQHLGLVMAMFGALAGERHGHLVTLGSSFGHVGPAAWRAGVRAAVQALSGLVCGLLALASWRFVATEIEVAQPLAYGVPVWWVQAALPAGFLLLGLRLGWRSAHGEPASPSTRALQATLALAAPLAGIALGVAFDGHAVPFVPGLLLLLAALFAGAPIFIVLGGLALLLFWSEGLPLASVPLSHYQITVNPSLPALPLFTLAGLVFARTGAAQRLGTLFVALFGGGVVGTVLAVAVVCTLFTAFTGGSGVTILALGGLLLPLLLKAGYPEQRGIGLVTSASALGVLLAPSVPLIMVAVIARVPIQDMFLAGLLPAVVMVLCLVIAGGFLRRRGLGAGAVAASGPEPTRATPCAKAALWAAKWELAAPLVAVGSLLSGIATPMESAALTAAYAIGTQAFAHRELDWRLLGRCIADCAMIIGGVMLILGMALALTNFLVDAGIPDRLIDWVQGSIPNRWMFLLALCLFLFVAAALMEIYAAIVVLVPLLLPLARAYGLDPVHFGIIFLAAMEVGFLCPPAGMNLYFASAMFGKPIRVVAASVAPALGAIFLGTLIVAAVPWLSTGLPGLFGPGR